MEQKGTLERSSIATTLTWEDSANEKKGELLGQAESAEVDYSILAKISLAAVKAGVDTADWDSTEYFKLSPVPIV